jgi:N-methylhydantoinase A
MTLIGIDTGGTFTDFVLWQGGRVRVHKVLSTPAAPEEAILQGISELGLDPNGLFVVHGSTVATNAVLEGKGSRTLYVGNRGLEDLLAIGRQARADLYDLQAPARYLPVPPGLCVGVGGRLAADGTSLEPLSPEDLVALMTAVSRAGPESVAINLLFSYLDDGPERTIAESLPAGLFVSRSSDVLPVAGEYERGVATWLNARVAPLVSRYLERLSAGLPGARVAVMQSSGETIAARQTDRHAVRLLLSGPAGGLAGAALAASAGGALRLLSLDMGGTSTDVAVIDGEPRLTTTGRIAGLPVALPMLDMHTIGAGGGSIARIDAGGLLLVGPESAGADPGPACYARGGKEATVTDANLVLGRLDPAGFLGGRMVLDRKAAEAALLPIARSLELSLQGAALGIVRLADEHMARALRVISVERGLDPRGFTLTSFGGAGGLHVCALADALGIREALVPVHAGVLSALGMLVARPGRTLTRSWIGPLSAAADQEIEAGLGLLAEQGVAELEAEGLDRVELRVEPSLDLRYRGQSYTLNLSWGGLAAATEAFHRGHAQAYGHRLDLPIELVNLRVRVRAPGRHMVLPHRSPAGAGNPTPARQLPAYGCARPVAVYRREGLAGGPQIPGPAMVTDSVATVWVASGWQAGLDALGNLWLCRQGEQPSGSGGRGDLPV